MVDIDKIRNSAGSMTIGDGDDALTGLYTLEDRMLVVFGGSVYSVQMADQIDPDRTNPNIPNVNQKLFDLGSDSEVIKRTLLTAGELFKSPPQADRVNVERARTIAFDVTTRIIAAHAAAETISTDVAAAMVRPVTIMKRAAQLPAVGNLRHRFGGFFQSVERAFQDMFQLCLLFFPDAGSKGKYFEGFRDFVEKELGRDSELYQFAAVLAQEVVFARNVRHCIEHEKEGQKLVINDFQMTSTGRLERPTLQVIHAATPHEKADLALFCTDFVNALVDAAEGLFAYLAGTNIEQSSLIAIQIGRAPPDYRQSGRSDVCYLVDLGGEMVRFG